MKLIRTAALLLMAAIATGCVNSQSASNAAVRIINAVQDGPLLNLAIDGTAQFSNVDYPLGTAYSTFGAGTYHLEVQQILPGNADGTANTPTILDLGDQTLNVNDELTIVMFGKRADPNYFDQSSNAPYIAIKTTTTPVSAGQTRLQFVNASWNLDASPNPLYHSVDIYVTPYSTGSATPEVTLTSSVTPIVSGLAYKDSKSRQEIPSGTLQIRVTPAGDPSTVLFDSGPTALAREADLLYAVVDYIGPDSAQHPLALSLLNGVTAGQVPDKAVRANLRFVHASAAVPPANLGVTLNNVTPSDPCYAAYAVPPASPPNGCDPVQQITGPFPFAAVNPGPAYPAGYIPETAYSLIPQTGGPDLYVTRTYSVTYTDADDSSGTAGTALYTGTATVPQGSSTTLIFGGTTGAFSQFSMAEAVRRVFTEARVRLFDAASFTGAVDVRLVPQTNPAVDLATVTAKVTGAIAGTDTGYIPLLDTPTADYEIILTASGADPTVDANNLLRKKLTVANGGVYEAVVINPTTTCMGLVPLEDFASPSVPHNTAPVLSATEAAALSFTTGAAAAAVTPATIVCDADNLTLASAAVQITAGHVSGEDVLGFVNTSGITGSWDPVTGTLTLTGADTLLNYQAALRAVTFTTGVVGTTRTVTFTVSDGTDTSNAVSRDITVQAGP